MTVKPELIPAALSLVCVAMKSLAIPQGNLERVRFFDAEFGMHEAGKAAPGPAPERGFGSDFSSEIGPVAFSLAEVVDGGGAAPGGQNLVEPLSSRSNELIPGKVGCHESPLGNDKPIAVPLLRVVVQSDRSVRSHRYRWCGIRDFSTDDLEFRGSGEDREAN